MKYPYRVRHSRRHFEGPLIHIRASYRAVMHICQGIRCHILPPICISHRRIETRLVSRLRCLLLLLLLLPFRLLPPPSTSLAPTAPASSISPATLPHPPAPTTPRTRPIRPPCPYRIPRPRPRHGFLLFATFVFVLIVFVCYLRLHRPQHLHVPPLCGPFGLLRRPRLPRITHP